MGWNVHLTGTNDDPSVEERILAVLKRVLDEITGHDDTAQATVSTANHGEGTLSAGPVSSPSTVRAPATNAPTADTPTAATTPTDTPPDSADAPAEPAATDTTPAPPAAG